MAPRRAKRKAKRNNENVNPDKEESVKNFLDHFESSTNKLLKMINSEREEYVSTIELLFKEELLKLPMGIRSLSLGEFKRHGFSFDEEYLEAIENSFLDSTINSSKKDKITPANQVMKKKRKRKKSPIPDTILGNKMVTRGTASKLQKGNIQTPLKTLPASYTGGSVAKKLKLSTKPAHAWDSSPAASSNFPGMKIILGGKEIDLSNMSTTSFSFDKSTKDQIALLRDHLSKLISTNNKN